jgi:hypothetical protein
MGLSNPTPSPRGTTEFESVLNQFESKLGESKEISTGIYDKARILSDFQLQCDMEKDEAQVKAPDGIITSLNQVLARIDYLNRRNSEILKHLNTLI